MRLQVLEQSLVRDQWLSYTILERRQIFFVFAKCHSHRVVHDLRDGALRVGRLEPNRLVGVSLEVNGGSLGAGLTHGIQLMIGETLWLVTS